MFGLEKTLLYIIYQIHNKTKQMLKENLVSNNNNKKIKNNNNYYYFCLYSYK